MSVAVWITIAIFLLVAAYRSIKRESSNTLSEMDTRFAKESIHEGFRCLGYAIVPKVANDAEAFQAGYDYCKSKGLNPLLAVSLVSSGMIANYSLSKMRDAAFSGLLALRSNTLLAEEFGINDTRLWDERNALFGKDENAKLIVNIVSRLGLKSCHCVHIDEEFGSALRKLA